MKKRTPKSIILWKDGKAVLYCSKNSRRNEWDVINGAWTLVLKDMVGHVLNDSKRKFTFDKMTEAPKVPGDYNAVMLAAEEQEKDSK